MQAQYNESILREKDHFKRIKEFEDECDRNDEQHGPNGRSDRTYIDWNSVSFAQSTTLPFVLEV